MVREISPFTPCPIYLLIGFCPSSTGLYLWLCVDVFICRPLSQMVDAEVRYHLELNGLTWSSKDEEGKGSSSKMKTIPSLIAGQSPHISILIDILFLASNPDGVFFFLGYRFSY